MFLGVYPKPVLDRIEPSVERLLAHVEDVNRAAGRDFHIATTEDGEHLSPVAADEPSSDGAGGADQSETDAAPTDDERDSISWPDQPGSDQPGSDQAASGQEAGR